MELRKYRVVGIEPRKNYELIGAEYEITPMVIEITEGAYYPSDEPDAPLDAVFSSPLGDFIGWVCRRGTKHEYVGRLHNIETGEL